MRISDWSSDVCSSDLFGIANRFRLLGEFEYGQGCSFGYPLKQRGASAACGAIVGCESTTLDGVIQCGGGYEIPRRYEAAGNSSGSSGTPGCPCPRCSPGHGSREERRVGKGCVRK